MTLTSVTLDKDISKIHGNNYYIPVRVIVDHKGKQFTRTKVYIQEADTFLGLEIQKRLDEAGLEVLTSLQNDPEILGYEPKGVDQFKLIKLIADPKDIVENAIAKDPGKRDHILTLMDADATPTQNKSLSNMMEVLGLTSFDIITGPFRLTRAEAQTAIRYFEGMVQKFNLRDSEL